MSLVYNDSTYSFTELLEKDNPLTIQHRNMSWTFEILTLISNIKLQKQEAAIRKCSSKLVLLKIL